MNVPIYHEVCDALGIDPMLMREIDKLAALTPIDSRRTWKRDLTYDEYDSLSEPWLMRRRPIITLDPL